MKVYALFENDYDAGSILKAVITRKDVAERFVEGRSHKYEGNRLKKRVSLIRQFLPSPRTKNVGSIPNS